ncbi:hypothetical protein BH10PSE7_BH10PSE7_25780 [soil metagenome]
MAAGATAKQIPPTAVSAARRHRGLETAGKRLIAVLARQNGEKSGRLKQEFNRVSSICRRAGDRDAADVIDRLLRFVDREGNPVVPMKLNALQIFGAAVQLSPEAVLLTKSIAQEYMYLPFAMAAPPFLVGDLVEAEFEFQTIGKGKLNVILCRDGATPFEAVTEMRDAAAATPRVKLSHAVRTVVRGFRLQIGLSPDMLDCAGIAVSLQNLRVRAIRDGRVISVGHAFLQSSQQPSSNDAGKIEEPGRVARIENLFDKLLMHFPRSPE